MTARSTILGEFAYTAEVAWAEATRTAGTKLMVLGEPELNLTQDMIALNPSVARQDDGVWGRRGVRGGTVSAEFELGGHGGTAAGALTKTDLVTLLGLFFGASDADAVGAAADGAGSPTVTHLDTAGSTFVIGDILRVGTAGDGRADGQPAVVGAFTDNGADEDITLLTALPAAPTTADAIYAMQMVHPNHNGSVSSLRILAASANLQFWCIGCFPQSAQISGLNPGEQPRIKLTWGMSDWEFANETFPGSLSHNAKPTAPVAGGSLFYGAEGATARTSIAFRSFDVTIDHIVTPLRGPGGGDYQDIVGAVRTSSRARVKITEDSEAATTSPARAGIWDSDENAATARHILYCANRQDGRALAMYFPSAVPDGSRPVQVGLDGLNRVEHSYMCNSGPTTTTDKTLSNWRLALG